MSTQSKRIRLLVEESKLSYQELERRTEIKKSSLQRYASGKTSKIPSDAIEKLSRFFNVSQAYLMGWSDEKDKPADEGELEDNVILMHRDGKVIRKEFSKEQMDMLFKMIDAVPEKPKDI